MPKVTYHGLSMTHSSNPSGTAYMFHQGEPTEVQPEDAKFYAIKEERGAPWTVDMGIVETVKETTEKVVETFTRSRRRGGRK